CYSYRSGSTYIV
nr:immunoglobulin light chain junction region [Macaca mulatta]